MSTVNGPSGGGAGRGNVSVTNINCENIDGASGPGPGGGSNNNNNNNNSHSSSNSSNGSNSSSNGTTTNNMMNGTSFYNGGIRISVPKMEESDESEPELSNIEKAAVGPVCMRDRKVAGPRPMSWEGELSETDETMDDGATNSPQEATEPTEQNVPVNFSDANALILTKTIKQEQPDQYPSSSKKPVQFHPDIVNLKYEPPDAVNSPLLARSKSNFLPANPSPDSAIHSVYTHSSPSQSPLTSRHAPYTPTLSRNNSDASYSSCYSYSSEFSPTHSPIQGRHLYANSASLHQALYKPMYDNGGSNGGGLELTTTKTPSSEDGSNMYDNGDALPSAGISRQQLINSPCPICGDKISGFHYGIFSCESCKGFFKRTVQNRKNYVCLRGSACPVTIATRKKCPACRFEKCLQRGMKLEAIREDRTRGGRSTYQCSYTLPTSMLSPNVPTELLQRGHQFQNGGGPQFKLEHSEPSSSSTMRPGVPSLLQEIMDVEHLWQYNETELARLNQPPKNQNTQAPIQINPFLANAGLNGENSSPDMIVNLCNIADHRLYKIVKWCKSLPLFKNISIDDQICLLINSWCELLLFSCCFRSISTPGEIRISLGKSITLAQARENGLQACIERMLNLTDHFRRLRVDRYEYVAMKVIVLLSSDTSELKESEKVRASQEKALQALQAYTLAYYPDMPAKFGELLLRIPELQRTCQLGKEMLTIKSKEGEEPSFNLLMELLRGEH